MADTRVQLEVQDWVRQEWMPTKYGMNFYRERLKIRSGGVFNFDVAPMNFWIAPYRCLR